MAHDRGSARQGTRSGHFEVGGAVQWRPVLPPDGTDRPFVDSTARFSPDSVTVFLAGAVSGSDAARSR